MPLVAKIDVDKTDRSKSVLYCLSSGYRFGTKTTRFCPLPLDIEGTLENTRTHGEK